jgi:ribosome-associated protein
MLEITPSVAIDERELHFDFIRSAGPGGQNVNKVATAVQLRFDVRASSLPREAKMRLLAIAGHRATAEGELVIEARRFRTQEQNREAALDRFAELVRKALLPPKRRKKTTPTQASKTRRLTEKKRKGEVKRMRRDRSFEKE